MQGWIIVGFLFVVVCGMNKYLDQAIAGVVSNLRNFGRPWMAYKKITKYLENIVETN